MTYRELYRALRAQLEDGGANAPAFDAACLLERFAGLRRGELPLRGAEPVPPEAEAQTLRAGRLRAAGEPLQYLLGEWDFLNLTLAVGPGVLIPRPDTELLCETAAARLKGMGPPEAGRPLRVLDLCAGSGCVALGTASLQPGLAVTAVEWSEEALAYLRQNCARYPGYSVEPVKADVLHDAGRFPDGWAAILSNPPYIPAADLPGLMPEVRREPRLALDGGEDGLCFYRTIARDWAGKLAPGGFCAVEVGIGQAGAVAALLQGAGLEEVEIFRDLGGVERVVLGVRPAES
ncbi:MAG TPA: peptide chain release factor N(5)-glutamine methyltransferase [Firmicutes bacterium]|nr:peptide chain release factor N(5)-glutamine methyltransferase [Bacillota bacterium]